MTGKSYSRDVSHELHFFSFLIIIILTQSSKSPNQIVYGKQERWTRDTRRLVGEPRGRDGEHTRINRQLSLYSYGAQVPHIVLHIVDEPSSTAF